jgi:hypothetical protein
MQRFDGNAAWHALSWADRNVIGGMALELFAAVRFEDPRIQVPPAFERALARAGMEITAALTDHIAGAVPALAHTAPLAVPSLLGQVCRVCGCSEHDACGDIDEMPCHWAEPDLCSACSGPPAPVRRKSKPRRDAPKEDA